MAITFSWTRTVSFPVAVCTAVAVFLVGCGGGAPIGTVTFGELVYQGDVDGNYLARQLGQLDPPFQACYVRVKRRERTAAGVIELKLTGGGGRISGEIVSNATGSTDLGECLLGAISGLHINEPPETAPWNYTADMAVTFELMGLEEDSN